MIILIMQFGQTFDSFAQFKSTLNQYETVDRQKFVIKGSRSRTIEAAQKMLKRKLNSDLKYYEAQLCCVHGGVVRTRGKGIRKTR
ncbi:unnamed protein product [Acanthoscelides obtectus]|uniref:ZSWIM3 N-terminal domain-containing protein n=1 Tax=Acanthoscelides obtectus TaxID=200917 RepID=A0A9P0MBQ5_ACAOB|nr:unnamed protein product [Acanthoscelides obtectus]CAK1688215.1 hypothetical protein AOBTE_LOCUS36614 [Acanthoscelides obtectus]